MIRVFVAVDIPAEFAGSIAGIQEKLAQYNLKLVRPELVHITLKFLGDVDEGNIDKICKALSTIRCDPFDAEIKGVGVFPNPNYIKVIWLGMEGNFDALSHEVDVVLKPLGFRKEKRKFTAHATLARVKHMAKDERVMLAETVESLKATRIGTMHISSMQLMKSTLTPQGPIYETLCEIPLKFTDTDI